MGKGREKRTERFTARFPASLYAKLQAVADADHRSQIDIVIIALERYFESLEREAAEAAARSKRKK